MFLDRSLLISALCFTASEVITVEGCPSSIFKNISIEEARKGDPVEVQWNAPTAEVTQRESDDISNIAARLIEGPSNNFFSLGSTLVKYEFRGKEKVETCSFWVFIITGKRNVLYHFSTSGEG